ncbi:MAG: hypothetical protein ACK5SM_01380, partial [Sphingomonadales bacterium]
AASVAGDVIASGLDAAGQSSAVASAVCKSGAAISTRFSAEPLLGKLIANTAAKHLLYIIPRTHPILITFSILEIPEVPSESSTKI